MCHLGVEAKASDGTDVRNLIATKEPLDFLGRDVPKTAMPYLLKAILHDWTTPPQ